MVKRLGIGLALLVPLLLCATMATVADGSEPPTEDRQAERAIAEAVRLRTSFGLFASEDFVRAAAADIDGYPDMNWGVPLSTIEASELERRTQVQLSLNQATDLAAERDDYAGFYIDQPAGGVPVFLFTQAEADFAERLASALPDGTAFRVEHRDRTHAELEDIELGLSQDVGEWQAEGIEIVSYGIAEASNVVLVGISGQSQQSALERLSGVYGAAIDVRAQGPAANDLCNSRSDCWPPRGGIKIVPNSGYCTSGFLAIRTDTSKKVVVTAGHCIALNGGTGTTWSHHGNTIGPAKEYVWEDYKNGDVGIIKINDSVADGMSSFKQYLSNYGPPPTTSYLSGIQLWTYQHEGDAVCRMGVTSGKTCGTIFIRVVTRLSCDGNNQNCKHIQYMNEVDFDSTGGDSGGSVFANVSPFPGYGIHIHSDDEDDPNVEPPLHGWYSPLDWERATLISERGVTIEYCTTSASSLC